MREIPFAVALVALVLSVPDMFGLVAMVAIAIAWHQSWKARHPKPKNILVALSKVVTPR